MYVKEINQNSRIWLRRKCTKKCTYKMYSLQDVTYLNNGLSDQNNIMVHVHN